MFLNLQTNGIAVNANMNVGVVQLLPTSCKVEVTAYSYYGAAITWGLYNAIPTAGTTNFTLGTQIATTPAT